MPIGNWNKQINPMLNLNQYTSMGVRSPIAVLNHGGRNSPPGKQSSGRCIDNPQSSNHITEYSANWGNVTDLVSDTYCRTLFWQLRNRPHCNCIYLSSDYLSTDWTLCASGEYSQNSKSAKPSISHTGQAISYLFSPRAEGSGSPSLWPGVQSWHLNKISRGCCGIWYSFDAGFSRKSVALLSFKYRSL